MIREMIEHGQIVPSHITVDLLRNAMDQSATKKVPSLASTPPSLSHSLSS